MINAFTNTLRQVYAVIPGPLLEAAFRPRDYQTTIDARIKEVIINGRVLPDCNVNGGKIKRIPLSSCMVEPVLPDPGYNSVLNPAQSTLYRVPAAARENRDIVGVIDVSWPYDYMGASDTPFGFGAAGNSVKSLAAAMLNSHTHRNACLTPVPTLLTNNMILINPSNSLFNDWNLVCRLGYDDEFTTLNRGAIQPLGNLVVAATKAYVWVNLVIRIDAGELSNGQELGQFKVIVDSYQNANEDYKEELKKTSAAALFDVEAQKYLMRAML